MSDENMSAAFEQALREHTELKALLQALRAFAEKPRPGVGAVGSHDWASNLSVRLLELHDKLIHHFKEEEHHGVLDELARRHPGAARRIEGMKDQHLEVLTGVRSLMSSALEYSEGRTPENQSLRGYLTSLLDAIDRHEEVETDLIQRLEYRDLGGEGA